MKPVYVPKNPHEKAMQRALIQYRNPKLRPLVYEALEKAGRTDLIGYGPKCLIRPENRTGNRPENSGPAADRDRTGQKRTGETEKENHTKYPQKEVNEMKRIAVVTVRFPPAWAESL